MYCTTYKQELEHNMECSLACSNGGDDGIKKCKVKILLRKVIVAAIIIGIIISGVFVVFTIKNNNLSPEDLSDSNYVAFSDGFTDVLVDDEISALKAIDSVAEKLGITNVKDELKTLSVNLVAGNTYYRFQQYYKDFPVYGRSVVIASDVSNNVSILTSNFTPMDMREIDIEPFDTEKTAKAITDYFKENENENVEKVFLPEVTEDNVMLYNFSDNNEVCAVYVFKASILSNNQTNFYEIVYNPKYGVLASSPVFQKTEKTVMVYSKGRKVSADGWITNDNIYQLYNDKYNISVYDFNNTTLPAENNIQADLSLYGYSVISSKNNNFSKQGVYALKNTISYCDYFASLGHKGFESIHVAINDCFDSGNNARGGSGISNGKSEALLMIGSNTGASDIDIGAHELRPITL